MESIVCELRARELSSIERLVDAMPVRTKKTMEKTSGCKAGKGRGSWRRSRGFGPGSFVVVCAVAVCVLVASASLIYVSNQAVLSVDVVDRLIRVTWSCDNVSFQEEPLVLSDVMRDMNVSFWVCFENLASHEILGTSIVTVIQHAGITDDSITDICVSLFGSMYSIKSGGSWLFGVGHVISGDSLTISFSGVDWPVGSVMTSKVTLLLHDTGGYTVTVGVQG